MYVYIYLYIYTHYKPLYNYNIKSHNIIFLLGLCFLNQFHTFFVAFSRAPQNSPSIEHESKDTRPISAEVTQGEPGDFVTNQFSLYKSINFVQINTMFKHFKQLFNKT